MSKQAGVNFGGRQILLIMQVRDQSRQQAEMWSINMPGSVHAAGRDVVSMQAETWLRKRAKVCYTENQIQAKCR